MDSSAVFFGYISLLLFRYVKKLCPRLTGISISGYNIKLNQFFEEVIMPTYEYECKKCEHRFDKFQKMTEKPLSKCPECGGKVARIIGMGGGIIFKGPGFYTTEYRSENYKKREREDKQGIGSSTGSSSSSCSSCAPSASCSTCKK